MTLPKFTDPAVQNRTQDAATDHVDDIQHKIDNPGKGKNSNSEDKKKGYREGNNDNSITERDDSNQTNKNADRSSFGKRL
jgi:hypothetical protein